ncbi:hypothetical protein FHW12_001209 [Dokdonella fugitiva]|uniref:Uncharacterized protein n=1 Tax=Dokdonella fugitiva TaxID=328517 RepID=A0A839F0J6_9GAMM|nr:hypothetical protein [Dokdonella fugitiva]MBA8887018.1 hypothetical protein [Dokdonella fugitiva]
MDVLQWTGIGSYAIPCALTLLGVVLVPIGNGLVRGLVAAVAGWIGCVAYTIFVFNPVGLASARAHGDHFPDVRYDNNTVSVAILAGWVVPLATLATYHAARRIFRRI